VVAVAVDGENRWPHVIEQSTLVPHKNVAVSGQFDHEQQWSYGDRQLGVRYGKWSIMTVGGDGNVCVDATRNFLSRTGRERKYEELSLCSYGARD
jgi:hypothetical protein